MFINKRLKIFNFIQDYMNLIYYLLEIVEVLFVFDFQVVVQAALYHSDKSLCDSVSTAEYPVSKDGRTKVDETLKFPLEVCNLPRMARLCFVVYEVTKTAKGLKSRRVKNEGRVRYNLFLL